MTCFFELAEEKSREIRGTGAHLAFQERRLLPYRAGSFRCHNRSLGFAMSGRNFFTETLSNSISVIYPEDRPVFAESFTKENVLAQIEKNGIFMLNYRLLMDGKPVNVGLKAALVQEDDGAKLMIGAYKKDNTSKSGRFRDWAKTFSPALHFWERRLFNALFAGGKPF